ncbi:MAG: recombinase family protein [Lachnospiraceae bacterium]|nr:recombinase family protein [Ruminococcus sp.]MCM1277275.1 recombinase family protein [Lachnospiraceae bacterium]
MKRVNYGRTKTYNTALYLRLSKDDGTDSESSFIQTQKEMLTRYARDNGFVPFSVYCDDGFTGTNSNRPDFQRMLNDIENGKINCVITKDLSRLGRNHIDTDIFMEIYFPEHNVRYIAIADNVDTSKSSTMSIAPFKNILNDFYSRDISQKSTAALRIKQKQGKFIGSKAPYGYEKDPADKNHLVINEKQAAVVRRIFQMAKEGMGVKNIAKTLSAKKILRPAAAAAAEHAEFKKYANDGKEYLWSGSVVRGILRNPAYKGSVVGHKSERKSYCSKKRSSCTPIIVEGMHEPIIAPEEWELVQQLITSRKSSVGESRKFDNIFCGLLICSDCGYTLGIRRSNRMRDSENDYANYDYYCNTYRELGPTECSSHRITASALHNAVLEDIQRLANEALEDDKQMISSIADRLGKAEEGNVRQVERELKRAQKRLAELDRLFTKLYEEHVNDEIDEHNYKNLSTSYNNEQKELETKIRELEDVINSRRENGENAETFVDTIRQYSEIDELTQAILHSLIDKIEVYEPEYVDGEYIQKLDIYYKFIGKID